MNNLSRIIAFCFLWAALPVGAVAQDGKISSDLPAKARWEVGYGKTDCRLIRHADESEGAYRLATERDWAFGGYQWALYGAALPLQSSMKSVSILLESDSKASPFKLDSYAVTEGPERRLAWHDADGLVFGALGDGDRIRMTSNRKLDVSMKLPKWGAAIKALEACENDLFASWGFDAQQIRLLSAMAAPSNNAARWVTNNDYPAADYGRRNEGTTTFLLNVDANGAATHCRIVDSSGFPSLDQRTCALVLTRSAFDPARDEAGRAVASFYMNRVRWQLPR